MLTQTLPPAPISNFPSSKDDGFWYTASSGMPAGENDHRLVAVANDPDAAKTKLEVELQRMNWLAESRGWIWSGAGTHAFRSEDEATSFANYLMGID